jgi:GDPmannose 4,6-dehydratase
MKKKIALVTGITGQDGAYMAKLLLNYGYKVYGAYRRTSSFNSWRLEELGIQNTIELVPFELLEKSNIERTIKLIKPNELYNFAAQSFVELSFQNPIYTANVDAISTLKILESIRMINRSIKFYQASSSEMFGGVTDQVLDERSKFYPRSPYAVAKAFGHYITINYREAYGIFACSGILFNHESPLRGIEFVTRKITSTLAEIKAGRKKVLELGNYYAKRDWGYAGDFVEGVWKMLQVKKPCDYVLATGEQHSVKEFATYAAKLYGFNIDWRGKKPNEYAVDKDTKKILIKKNPKYDRPSDVFTLKGRSNKARKDLKWSPKTKFKNLVKMMVEADRKRSISGRILY